MIEPMEPVWQEPIAKQLYEQCQSEVARIYTVPPRATQSPDAFFKWHDEAKRAAEPLVRLMTEIYFRHTSPRIFIKLA